MSRKELLDKLSRKVQLDELYQDRGCEVMAKELDIPVECVYKVDRPIFDMVYLEKDKGIIVPICSASSIEDIKHSIRFSRQFYIKYFNDKNYKKMFHILGLSHKEYGVMLFEILKDFIPEEEKQECLEIAINGPNEDDKF